MPTSLSIKIMRIATGFCALVGLLGLSAGCTNKQSQGTSRSAESVAKVVVAKPITQQVTDYVDRTGRTESVESVEIRARVSGYLTKVQFMGSLDSEVNKGDLLFEIDERPYKNALASAEARLASAQASLKTSSAELERTEGLFKRNVLVQADLDRDVGRKSQADAEILSAQAGIDQAQLDLEFTRITAPIGGLISKPNLTIGNLVTPSTSALTTLVSVDPMYVYFDLDEPTLLTIQRNIREGRLASRDEHDYQVLLGLINDEGYPIAGSLDFIDNRIDPNTGTIRVRGAFDNPKPERGPRPLASGLFARVRIPLGKPHEALLITERAIVRSQGKTFTFVVSDGLVEKREVTLGAIHGNLRVVSAGLQPTERIVINGLQRVRHGSKVEAIEKPMIESGAPTQDDTSNAQ